MEPLYRLTEMVVCTSLRRAVRWQIEGLERIAEAGAVLIASNHVSYLDPFAVGYMAHLAGRRARILAKAELFEGRVTGSMMRAYGHIPVDRGAADAGALGRAADTLAAGECVLMFPEGTLSEDLDPMAGRTGAARLARASGVPVVPLGLWGTHRLIPPGRSKVSPETGARRPRPRLGQAVTAVFGEPVVVASTANPREATDRIMAGVCSSVARARVIYPQVPGPGDDGWWVRGPETARLRSCRGRVAQQLLDDQQNR